MCRAFWLLINVPPALPSPERSIALKTNAANAELAAQCSQQMSLRVFPELHVLKASEDTLSLASLTSTAYAIVEPPIMSRPPHVMTTQPAFAVPAAAAACAYAQRVAEPGAPFISATPRPTSMLRLLTRINGAALEGQCCAAQQTLHYRPSFVFDALTAGVGPQTSCCGGPFNVSNAHPFWTIPVAVVVLKAPGSESSCAGSNSDDLGFENDSGRYGRLLRTANWDAAGPNRALPQPADMPQSSKQLPPRPPSRAVLLRGGSDSGKRTSSATRPEARPLAVSKLTLDGGNTPETAQSDSNVRPVAHERRNSATSFRSLRAAALSSGKLPGSFSASFASLDEGDADGASGLQPDFPEGAAAGGGGLRGGRVPVRLANVPSGALQETAQVRGGLLNSSHALLVHLWRQRSSPEATLSASAAERTTNSPDECSSGQHIDQALTHTSPCTVCDVSTEPNDAQSRCVQPAQTKRPSTLRKSVCSMTALPLVAAGGAAPAEADRDVCSLCVLGSDATTAAVVPSPVGASDCGRAARAVADKQSPTRYKRFLRMRCADDLSVCC